jgi:hypothetical protein
MTIYFPGQAVNFTISPVALNRPVVLSLKSKPDSSKATLTVSEPRYAQGQAVYNIAFDAEGTYRITANGKTFYQNITASRHSDGSTTWPTTFTINEQDWGGTSAPASVRIVSAPSETLTGTTHMLTSSTLGQSSYSFTPDAGGIYTFANATGTASTTIEVATKLTHVVASTTGGHSATLAIHVSGGVVVEFGITRDPVTNAVTYRDPAATPGLSAPSDAAAGFAIQSTAVVAAVASLVGMNAVGLTAGLADVVTTFSAAIVTPPAIATEDAAVPALVGQGWVKS